MPRIDKPTITPARVREVETPETPAAGGAAEAETPALTAPEVQPAEVGGATAHGSAAPSATRGGPGALRHDLEAQIPPSERGPDAPPLPEVTRVLEQYGVDGRLGRPRERVATWVGRIQDAFMEAGAADAAPADLANNLLANDTRLQVFYLEGILKLYRKNYPEAEAVYGQVKALEDALGQASGNRSALAMAQKHDSVPPVAIEWLEGQVKKTDSALADLIAAQWTPDDDGKLPALGSVLSFLENTDWDSYKDDKKYLKKEIGRRLKKFEEAPLDMNVLQGDFGVHELRRQIRWFPIYAVALDGLVAFDEESNPIKEYKKLLDDPDLVNNKYAQLPESVREKKPIEFSRSLYLRNTQLITELGKLKDSGEEIEAVAFALQGAGLAHDMHHATEQAEQLLGVGSDAEEAVFEAAGKIWDEMQNNDYIKAMRKEVKGK
jgi:hypothetical protein